jgi:DNA polymerase-3 subunit gamma/tau
MRDAIGTLDQLASFTGGSITVADVEGLLGEVDTARLFEVTGLIADRDVAGLFAFVADLVESGHDVAEFVRALTGHVRDLYVLAATSETAGIVDVTESDAARLRTQAALFDLDRLARVLDELGRVAGELRWAPDNRLALEVALARIARPASDLTLESLAERVGALEAGSAAHATIVTTPAPAARPARMPAAEKPVAQPPVAPSSAPTSRVAPSRESVPAPAATAPAAPAPEAPAPEAPAAAAPSAAPAAPKSTGAARRPAPPAFDVAELRRRWKDVLREVKTVRPAASKMFLDTEADLDGDTVVVEFRPEGRVFKSMAEDAEVTALLRRSVEAVLGWHVAIRYQLGRGSVRVEDLDDEHGSRDRDGAAPLSAPAQPADDDSLDRLLSEGLGAQVVSESDKDPRKGTQ